MIQLLLHLWGDFILQNHWMAANKTNFDHKGWFACFVHCLLYTIPFAIIASPPALVVIFGTHFIIDKFRLATYLAQLKNWAFTETGFPKEVPAFLSVWLVFIVDNTLHLTINYLAIAYL